MSEIDEREWQRCEWCDGSGEVGHRLTDDLRACPTCDGSGQQWLGKRPLAALLDDVDGDLAEIEGIAELVRKRDAAARKRRRA